MAGKMKKTGIKNAKKLNGKKDKFQLKKFEKSFEEDEENGAEVDNMESDFVPFDTNHHTQNNNSDEDDEVFNLDIDEDSQSEDEQSDEFEDEPDDLRQLVKNLPDKLRQKVLSKQDTVDSDIDDDVDNNNTKTTWGRKKKTYWEGDTADLEIGQDLADAEEEEEAVKELYQEKLNQMEEADFLDMDVDDNIMDRNGKQDLSMEELLRGGKGLKRNTKKNSTTMPKDFQFVFDQKFVSDEGDVEQMSRDVSQLTSDQKLKLLSSQSPELIGLVNDLKDRVSELKGRILPVKTMIEKMTANDSNLGVDKDIVEYLEVKQQLLLCYCLNMVFYLYMKSLGKSVQSHPVMKQLLKIRYVMEKIRILDGKMKYQIDRLVQLSQIEPSEQINGDLLRPNPNSLLERFGLENGQHDEAPDEEDGDDRDVEKSDNIYRPPKMVSQPYEEQEKEASKREKLLEKQRKKLKHSELMESLQEEFGSAPENVSSSGIGNMSGDMKKMDEDMEEKRKFEEERFVRLTITKKEKNEQKRRFQESNQLDNFDDLGDIGILNEINKLNENSKRSSVHKESSSSAVAMEKAIQALNSNKNGNGMKLSSGNIEEHFENILNSDEMNYDRKRRRAPETGFHDEEFGDTVDQGEDDDDDDDQVYDDFTAKKKEFLQKKKDHYTVEPRYGGYEEVVADESKRAATYEIIQNKGLTPHRKKANRNPRVKKREMYNKAVIARKGQVREVNQSVKSTSYGGELTGIKANLSRSRKINS